jgi:hypothetical protein
MNSNKIASAMPSRPASANTISIRSHHFMSIVISPVFRSAGSLLEKAWSARATGPSEVYTRNALRG